MGGIPSRGLQVFPFLPGQPGRPPTQQLSIFQTRLAFHAHPPFFTPTLSCSLSDLSFPLRERPQFLTLFFSLNSKLFTNKYMFGMVAHAFKSQYLRQRHRQVDFCELRPV